MVLSLLLWIGCAEYELGFQSVPLLTNTLDTGTNAYDTAGNTNDTQDDDPFSENPWNGECGDGLDNDGDGFIDCSDSDCIAAPECSSAEYMDTDGDGYTDDVDCAPYNPYVNPGAQEVANNGVDDDCDGTIDNNSNDTGEDTDTGNPQVGTVCSDTCTDGLGNIFYGANDGTCQDGGFGDFTSLSIGTSTCAFGTDCSDCGARVDADGDLHEDDPQGLGLALYSDCDDTDPTINSSATDIPGDGIDQDCDGSDASTGGGSSGSGSTGGCANNEIEDCNGTCLPAGWFGDGICDHHPNPNTNSVYGNYSLMCAALNWDNGDCPNNSSCATGEIIDCNGNCTSESTLGTGTCDSEFDCQIWYFDNNDC